MLCTPVCGPTRIETVSRFDASSGPFLYTSGLSGGRTVAVIRPSLFHQTSRLWNRLFLDPVGLCDAALLATKTLLESVTGQLADKLSFAARPASRRRKDKLGFSKNLLYFSDPKKTRRACFACHQDRHAGQRMYPPDSELLQSRWQFPLCSRADQSRNLFHAAQPRECRCHSQRVGGKCGQGS